MNIVYFIGNETDRGIEKISPEFSDSIDALIELESLREVFPAARICEEHYCNNNAEEWLQ